jgi:rhodanese-related sulfurtransferase
MYKILFILYLSPLIASCQGQKPGIRPAVSDPAFDKELLNILDFSIPLLGVNELQNMNDSIYILDARALEEYTVSHIPGALHIGYKKLNTEILAQIPRDNKVIIYCSVGYRSEIIGKLLQQEGFTDVSNLYGSIFEWVNRGYPIVGPDEKPTRNLHTYNAKWGKWVTNPAIQKTW